MSALILRGTAADSADAIVKAQDLVRFIENKYRSAGRPDQEDEKNALISAIYCYVGVGVVYDLNPTDGPKAFTTALKYGGVYFPANAVPVGTFIVLNDLDPNGSYLNTDLDKYPSYIEIRLIDADGNPVSPVLTNGKPQVAVCLPTGMNTAVFARVLLGHQPTSGFKLYERENINSLLTSQLACSEGPLSISAQTPMGRAIHRVADWLLPEKLHAWMFAFGGVGGSPEEFSPFGAVDGGLSFGGGAGGSPEEFAPIALPEATASASGPMLAPAAPADTIDGPVTTTAANVGKVTVVTSGGDLRFGGNGVNGIAGIKVIYTIADAKYSSPPGKAVLCDNLTEYVTETNADGEASLDCLDFGTEAGYRNLKATVHPSSLGLLNSQQLSLVTATNPLGGNDANFLVRTLAGAPTALAISTQPGGAKAGEELSTQPTVQLLDQYGNPAPVSGIQIDVAIGDGLGNLFGTTSGNTGDDGALTFSGLYIGGLAGDRTLVFSTTASEIGSVESEVFTISVGDAALLKLSPAPSGTAQAGVPFAQQPSIRVEDEWGNLVEAGVYSIDVATNGGILGGTEPKNTVNGIAAFDDLFLGGETGVRKLTFSTDGLAPAVHSVTVSAGPANKLTIETQPSGTALAGVPFGQQPVVQVRDQYGNAVATPAPGLDVAAAIATGEPALGGTITVQTNTSGVATFGNLSINGSEGTRTLRFTSGLPTGTPNSNNIVVSEGPAFGIQIVEGNSQTAPAYGAVAVDPKVKVVDAYGNGVEGAIVTWSPSVGAIDPTAPTTTGSDGTTALTSWTLGVGTNTLLAEVTVPGSLGPVTKSVQFTATGTFTLTLANACVTGGAKDDITKYGFYFPDEPKDIQALGVNLSSNGAPGSSENYLITLTVTQGATSRTATGKLQSSSNSSKGVESEVIFDFGSNPLPKAGTGEITVRMTAQQVVNGAPSPMPANRVLNMNAGGCAAGSKNCKPVKVVGAGTCNITESQLSPFVKDYRKGLAARVYTIN